MGTLFWLPSTGSPAVTPTPSGWSHTNSVSFPLNLVNGGSALGNTVYTPDAADHITAGTAMIAQFVSGSLPPQTVAAQDVTLCLRCLEADAGNNVQLAMKIYATNLAGNSVLGTLLALTANGVEMGTALTGAALKATTSAVTLTTAWRLVVEVGCSGTPTATTGTQGHNATLELGEAYTSATVPALVQHADTTQGTPTLMFEDGIAAHDPAAKMGAF